MLRRGKSLSSQYGSLRGGNCLLKRFQQKLAVRQCQKGFCVAVFFKRQCYTYFALPCPENSDSGLMRFCIREIDEFYLFHRLITLPVRKWIARHIPFVMNVLRVNMPVRATMKLRRTKMIRMLFVSNLDFCRWSPYYLVTSRRWRQIRHFRSDNSKNGFHLGRCRGKHSQQVERHTLVHIDCLNSGHLQRRECLFAHIALRNQRFVLVPEVVQRAFAREEPGQRHRGGIAQSAEAPAKDVVADVQ